jgi:vancomycin resistance protein YoaR
MKTSFLLYSLPLVLAGVAGAQTLPAPAPAPAPKTQPTPTVETPLLDNPRSFEEPLIIGEPVRKQNGGPRPNAAQPQLAPRPRASVAGVSLVGLSDGAAVAKLRAALAPALKEPVRLVIGGYQYTFLREELGASLPLWPLMRQARAQNGAVALRLQIDSKKLVAILQELDAQVRVDFEKTALNIGGSATRIKLALESVPIAGSVNLLTTALKASETPAPKVESAPKTEETTAPPVGKGEFPYLLARFSTRYDAGLRGRTTNLRMAAKHIDGTVIGPGKTFSTNLAIGPRNAAAGWREAQMFVSGRVVSGTGAGICQAASTLYNAALLGNFPIVERHAHSMRVMYVPPSRDAALMWGSKDFKFRNTSDGAIQVRTSVSGGQFHVKLWGQKPGETEPVRVVSRVLSRKGGTRSEAYKIVGDQKIRLSRDAYKPHP